MERESTGIRRRYARVRRHLDGSGAGVLSWLRLGQARSIADGPRLDAPHGVGEHVSPSIADHSGQAYFATSARSATWTRRRSPSRSMRPWAQRPTREPSRLDRLGIRDQQGRPPAALMPPGHRQRVEDRDIFLPTTFLVSVAGTAVASAVATQGGERPDVDVKPEWSVEVGGHRSSKRFTRRVAVPGHAAPDQRRSGPRTMHAPLGLHR